MPGLAVYSAAVEYVVVGRAFCQRRWLAEEARVSGEKVQRRSVWLVWGRSMSWQCRWCALGAGLAAAAGGVSPS
ncbi:hypothetical protein RchiOBHm_Chr7g0243801 [Rosa chinensis]|uniref:Uncharacterized protein n=1 Tax=Rosa chinensis TaxID=74649 RepID=A0A2P6PIU6_ROSCH|nr:hypothetical protein RchiOBHm_Chr7g0243801 [Rosa chinensis]